MKDNILIEKSIDFGARIVKLHHFLLKTKHESVLSKQILRSGTSIGANIHEAQYGNSKADFIAKLHIALKETAETEYWLHILEKSDYLDDKMASSLLNDCLEIKRILIASLQTAKDNSSRQGEQHE
ncbi:MAG: four helix bundle protein [Clostridia bacterium]|nr:four helix bundle protein [Clostridia bacterium]